MHQAFDQSRGLSGRGEKWCDPATAARDLNIGQPIGNTRPSTMDGRPYSVEVVVDGPALSTPDVIEAVSRAVRAARMRGCTRAIVTYEFAGVDGPENHDIHLPVGARDATAIRALRRNMEMRQETMREVRGVRRIRLIA